MSPPLRRALLNAEISFQARKIAHEHTKSCSKKYPVIPIDDVHHTAKCNKLTTEIQGLAWVIKVSALQPPEKREEAPPPFELEAEVDGAA